MTPPQEASYAPARDYPASAVRFRRADKARRHARGPIGWASPAGSALFALIVLVIGWAAETPIAEQIASLWPQSSSLYSALGLKVNARGITSSIRADHVEKEDGQFVLVVTGKLVNITQRELTVPPLSVVLTDDDMRSLYQWSFSPGASTLKPGESVPFRTRLSSRPAGVEHLQIRFSGAG